MIEREMKNKALQNNLGFTAIEVVMVIAIFSIILSSVFTLTTKKTYTDALTAKSMEIVDLIDQARNFSVSGYYDDFWSIRTYGGPNSAICTADAINGGCFVLFKGDDYNNRDSSYDRKVVLDGGTYIDRSFSGLSFKKVSGYVDDNYDFSIKTNLGPTKTVYVKKTGLIYYE